ncbi:MAG: hypothetical protein ACFCUM_13025 [Bacteroidales bacterium]
MINFLDGFPDRDILIASYKEKEASRVPDVNGHIHTPYSFSAFDDTQQAFILASREQVRILGINDFNTTLGYEDFSRFGIKYKVFPLFNIEFMGLLKNEQQDGIRVNDPNNPGRIYFSGKGLDFPVSFSPLSIEKIIGITTESHRQVRQMTEKLNQQLKSADGSLHLDFDEIKKRFTKGMVRERHIARAVRLMMEVKCSSDEERKEFLKTLYGGKESSADVTSPAAVENDIRGRMLKAGGAAFVEEDPAAFLDLGEIISIIRDGGGIPCYPVLLDDTRGWKTEFESDAEALYKSLRSWDVSCIELIPGRNDLNILKSFVTFFREKGFIVMFGTEHNTPSLDPLKVSARGGVPLDEELRIVGYEGACIVAAHQYLRAKGEQGYVSFPEREFKEKNSEFITLGKAVIDRFLNG